MRRAGAGDRGTGTVETAIVLPVLLLVLFGIIELGGALNAYSGTAGAVRSAGRAGSVAGSDPMADALILDRIGRDVRSSGADVELVVIWHAAGPGDAVPAGCLPTPTGSPNTTSVGVSDGGVDALGACNAYLEPGAPGGAFAAAAGTAAQPASHYFGCQGAADPLAAAKLDCRWPGQHRRVLTAPRTAVPHPTDFVGVYVRVRHDYVTRLFGPGVTITDSSVNLIEPQGYEFA